MANHYTGPVLVIGGAGFVGSHLVDALVARGAAVTVVDNLNTGSRENLATAVGQVEMIDLDICHDDLRPLLRDGSFATVFHLAANSLTAPSVEDPLSDLTLNAGGTLHVLEAMRAVSPGTALVHASTGTVYGEAGGRPLRESDPVNPGSPYAVSKLAAERYVAVYARLFGLRTAIVRFFALFGERQRKQVVYDLLYKIATNAEELFIFGDGTEERDFVHVGNAVEACLVVSTRATFGGEVYNVGGHEILSILELARRLCDLMDAQPRLVFSGSVRPGEYHRFTGDSTRLRGLGYEQVVDLMTGLARTVTWFRSVRNQ